MKRSSKIFLFLLLAEIAFFSIWWVKINNDIARVNAQVENVKEEIKRLKEENQRLLEMQGKANNPFFREKMAREKLGLARKGEIVYRIVQKKN